MITRDTNRQSNRFYTMIQMIKRTFGAVYRTYTESGAIGLRHFDVSQLFHSKVSFILIHQNKYALNCK